MKSKKIYKNLNIIFITLLFLLSFYCCKLYHFSQNTEEKYRTSKHRFDVLQESINSSIIIENSITGKRFTIGETKFKPYTDKLFLIINDFSCDACIQSISTFVNQSLKVSEKENLVIILDINNSNQFQYYRNSIFKNFMVLDKKLIIDKHHFTINNPLFLNLIL